VGRIVGQGSPAELKRGQSGSTPAVVSVKKSEEIPGRPKRACGPGNGRARRQWDLSTARARRDRREPRTLHDTDGRATRWNPSASREQIGPTL
jgi:hypothetical protein